MSHLDLIVYVFNSVFSYVLILVVMDVALGHFAAVTIDDSNGSVLILVVMDVALGRTSGESKTRRHQMVLILVVMDVALGLLQQMKVID